MSMKFLNIDNGNKYKQKRWITNVCTVFIFIE